MGSGFRIGIDLGGTKIEAAALDRDGRVALSRRVATPVGDYSLTVAAIVDLVGAIERELLIKAPVGVGIPGAISPRTGLVKGANSTCLIGRPLKEDLEEALERPLRLMNDANCFALSEAEGGAGKGRETVFGVILGTGVGGGVVIGGRVLAGLNAIAGEWGHNPLPSPTPDEIPGPLCWCGRRGCVETFLSGPALAADHRRHGGESLSPQEIAAASRKGEEACRATLERYAERLARALAAVVNLLDPQVIVLGGGLSEIALFYERVPPLLPRHVFSDFVDTEILPPVYGAASGVRGAAFLWPPESAA